MAYFRYLAVHKRSVERPCENYFSRSRYSGNYARADINYLRHARHRRSSSNQITLRSPSRARRQCRRFVNRAAARQCQQRRSHGNGPAARPLSRHCARVLMSTNQLCSSISISRHLIAVIEAVKYHTHSLKRDAAASNPQAALRHFTGGREKHS